MTRRRLFLAALLAPVLWGSQIASAAAQVFPSGRVTFVVPYVAGGTTDVIARALADELGKLWKHPVVVENFSGAGGIAGTVRVAKADPDGLTLLVTVQDPLVLNRFLFKDLPYDPDKGLAPVTMVSRSPQIVIANASFPANSLQELIDAARSSASGISYSSSGLGSQPYLLFETLAKRYGGKFVQVPYRGIAPAMTALMTGEVMVSTGTAASAGSMLQDGKIKALAFGGPKRSPKYPNVPTMAELGYADLDATAWWGLFAPGGTPASIVDRINRDIVTVAQQPAFIEKYFERFGMEPVLDSPAEFATAIHRDVTIAADMVKAADLKPLE